MEAQVTDASKLLIVPVEVPLASGTQAAAIAFTLACGMVGCVLCYFAGKEEGEFEGAMTLRRKENNFEVEKTKLQRELIDLRRELEKQEYRNSRESASQ